MLEDNLVELFSRGIVEGFLFVLLNHAFAKKKINKIPFIMSSVILIIFTGCVRFLNLNFGVHTILNLICLIFICVYINKIDLFASVKGSMLTTLLMFVVEAVNVILLRLILGNHFNDVINDTYKKAVAGIPGILLFGVVAFILYFKLTKVKVKDEEESDGIEIGTSGK